VCWQLPLRLEESTDDHGHVTSTLREWKRRDWGGGGAEFHWWCTVSLREELVALVGDEIYTIIASLLKDRRRRVFVPHPTVRRPT
jgi:hypothetical protein